MGPEESPTDNYATARSDVASWRGSCLDVYARGERAIGQCLLAMKSHSKFGETVKLQHLAGQRTATVQGLLDGLGLTGKALKAVKNALDLWLQLDSQRAFLAHGVVQVALDQKGQWVAIFDMVVFRANIATSQRWAVTALEAKEHTERLETAWKSLSAQLGQVRKRVSG